MISAWVHWLATYVRFRPEADLTKCRLEQTTGGFMSTMLDLAIQQAKALAEQLSSPMPESAAGDGWRQETWAKWAGIFEGIATSLVEGREVAPASISRALDMDGIHDGAILEAAATLSNHLRRVC